MEFLFDWKYLLLLVIIIYLIVHFYIISNYNAHRRQMKETFKRINKSAADIHRQVDQITKDLKS